eukprot:2107497-Prorocentrum_lima.AAC.1
MCIRDRPLRPTSGTLPSWIPRLPAWETKVEHYYHQAITFYGKTPEIGSITIVRNLLPRIPVAGQ